MKMNNMRDREEGLVEFGVKLFPLSIYTSYHRAYQYLATPVKESRNIFYFRVSRVMP